MPIELESGNVQLTDEEIVLYAPAAVLIARALRENIPLDAPMTRTQFTVLYFAHAVVTNDEDLMLEISAIVEREVEMRRRRH